MGANGERSFWKVLGPGLLYAGAAVGVSHLVQSTRAGAVYGVSLLGVVILSNVLKYPAFAFGPRYAAATGTSLVEGYRRRGRWALLVFGLFTLGTMFFVQAAVTLVTAGLAKQVLGIDAGPQAGPVAAWLASPVGISAGLLAVALLVTAVGGFRWLDRIIKVIFAVLTVATLAATVLVLPRVPWGGPWVPDVSAWDLKTVAFLAALVGWMPSPIDISVWHSLWTLARRRDTGHAPTLAEADLDFNIGYLATAFLALCFVLLGAGVMHGAGVQPANSAAGFAAQVIALYTETLGAWAGPILGVAAFGVMVSTTLTVVDGFPRALTALGHVWREPERADDAGRPQELASRRAYWVWIVVLAVGSVIVLQFLLSSLKTFVDLATTLSFLTGPLLAILNHRSVTGPEVPPEARPGRAMRLYSVVAIVFLWLIALGWVALLVWPR